MQTIRVQIIGIINLKFILYKNGRIIPDKAVPSLGILSERLYANAKYLLSNHLLIIKPFFINIIYIHYIM